MVQGGDRKQALEISQGYSVMKLLAGCFGVDVSPSDAMGCSLFCFIKHI